MTRFDYNVPLWRQRENLYLIIALVMFWVFFVRMRIADGKCGIFYRYSFIFITPKSLMEHSYTYCSVEKA